MAEVYDQFKGQRFRVQKRDSKAIRPSWREVIKGTQTQNGNHL
jgi:hypothetical protein